MAILMLLEFDGVTTEQYDQVNEELDPASNPPKGLILHSGAETDAGMKVVDIWESADAWQDFLDNRLSPAVVEVMGPPPEGAEPPPIEIRELRDLVQP